MFVVIRDDETVVGEYADMIVARAVAYQQIRLGTRALRITMDGKTLEEFSMAAEYLRGDAAMESYKNVPGFGDY